MRYPRIVLTNANQCYQSVHLKIALNLVERTIDDNHMFFCVVEHIHMMLGHQLIELCTNWYHLFVVITLGKINLRCHSMFDRPKTHNWANLVQGFFAYKSFVLYFALDYGFWKWHVNLWRSISVPNKWMRERKKGL